MDGTTLSRGAFLNARGETVVPYDIFKQMSPDAILKSAAQPYPRHLKQRCTECGGRLNHPRVGFETGHAIDCPLVSG